MLTKLCSFRARLEHVFALSYFLAKNQLNFEVESSTSIKLIPQNVLCVHSWKLRSCWPRQRGHRSDAIMPWMHRQRMARWKNNKITDKSSLWSSVVQMLVPFSWTALTFTATTLVCERSLTNTPLLDIVASLTVPPHPGLQCRSRRRSNNEDVLNGAGESQDLLCTDKSSSTTTRKWRNSSCKQRRTTCATRSSAVLLAKFSSTSQISCRARRRTAPSQAPSPLLISQIRLEISSRLRSRDWGMSLMLRLDSLTSRSSVVPLLKPSPLWQSSKWRTSSLKPQRSHACLIPSRHA